MKLCTTNEYDEKLRAKAGLLKIFYFIYLLNRIDFNTHAQCRGLLSQATSKHVQSTVHKGAQDIFNDDANFFNPH